MEEIIVIAFGLVIGSFLNVVIYRLPRGESIVYPPSHCPNCEKEIKPYDNIPVISYIILGGKCRYCKAKISIRYFLIEILTALVFLIMYLNFKDNIIYCIFSIIFFSIMIILAFIDFEHMILPDELTLGGAVLFFVYSFFNPYLSTKESITAGIGGALFFALLYFFYLKVRKIEALGFGDVKMMLMIGFFLGIKKTIIMVFISSFLGLIVGLFFIIFKKKTMQFAMPFGTFLSIGSLLSFLYSEKIFNLLINLTSFLRN